MVPTRFSETVNAIFEKYILPTNPLYMKYKKDSNTFAGQKKQEGHTTKPAMKRYFEEKRWLKNKARNIAKANKPN